MFRHYSEPLWEYHSFKAGMVICTKENSDKIFSVLSEYEVEIDGEIVKDTTVMNQKYYDFDAWIIRRKDGSLARKKALKSEIEKIKLRDIEKNWATLYEDKWNDFVQRLENAILFSKMESIPELEMGYLMKFFIALDWRSLQSNA